MTACLRHLGLALRSGQIFCQHQLTLTPPNDLAVQAHARVGVNHVRNSEANYPDSAYSPLERGLARLEALTDAQPACWGAYREVYEGRDSYDRCAGDAFRTACVTVDRPHWFSKPASCTGGRQPMF